MRILFVVPEYEGLVKVGGLSDFNRAVAVELKNMGHDVRVLMPHYRSLYKEKTRTVIDNLEVPVSVWHTFKCKIEGLMHDRIPVYLVNNTPMYDRAGIYDESGSAYDDNPLRFALLSNAAFPFCEAINWQPDIMHCCDWQSALVPFYLREHHAHNPFFRHTRTVLTLHNGAYQGHHAFEWHEAIGIHPKFMIPGLFEDRSSLNLMKGGIVLSHRVTTVSPNYRDELLTAEMGHGLHHTLMPRSASFVGILNGVDNDAWSPEFDVLQPIAFDESSLDKKEECKRLLQEKLGLAVDRERPLFAYIGRIAHQKGFELMLPALEELLPTGIQAVFVGHGEARYQGPMADLQSRYPDSFRYVNDFSPEATRPVLGASDFLLMPSLFEPCGLTQLYAMRYGTIPIVTPVGGLKSTVTPVDSQKSNKHQATGYHALDTTPEALKVTIKEAIKDFKTAPMVIHQLRLNAMRKRFLWSTAAEQYLTIYFDLTGGIDPMASLVKR